MRVWHYDYRSVSGCVAPLGVRILRRRRRYRDHEGAIRMVRGQLDRIAAMGDLDRLVVVCDAESLAVVHAPLVVQVHLHARCVCAALPVQRPLPVRRLEQHGLSAVFFRNQTGILMGPRYGALAPK